MLRFCVFIIKIFLRVRISHIVTILSYSEILNYRSPKLLDALTGEERIEHCYYGQTLVRGVVFLAASCCIFFLKEHINCGRAAYRVRISEHFLSFSCLSFRY